MLKGVMGHRSGPSRWSSEGSKMRGLKGKTAIITGGLGDLGYASAERLVQEGCKVALFDLKEDILRSMRSRNPSIASQYWNPIYMMM